MFRKTLLACTVALPFGLMGMAPAALADRDVEVHFGVPFYSYQVSPRYRYYQEYGWYDAYRYPRFRHVYYNDDDYDYVVVHGDDDSDYVYGDDDYVVIPGD